jgi:ABC-2 type transport system ATP-binding protein
MDAILEVQGLCKQYKKSDFRLENVSFSVPKGSIMGFVGENGAGKTTTIGCILNTLIRDSGTVKIFGKEMKADSTDIRDDIGVVYDASSFGNHLTATNIAKVMKSLFSRWDDSKFYGYLEQFKLPPKQKIKKYSRGMTMKLGLAVALSHDPKLLILDEATGGLDPVVREEILEMFLEFVHNESNSILLSSHITTDLEKIADYITFIHNGEIILSQKKDDLRYEYGVMRCKASQFETLDKGDIVAYRNREHQIDVLIADKSVAKKKYPNIVLDNISIEEILLMIIKGGAVKWAKIVQ